MADEYLELYEHIIAKLKELDATSLAIEISAIVAQGKITTHDGEDKLEPLSSRDRALIAMDMIVAAADVALQKRHIAKILGGEPTWKFDSLENRKGQTTLSDLDWTPEEVQQLPTLSQDEQSELQDSAVKLAGLLEKRRKENGNP